jgi:hypothetical protein
MRTYFEGLTTTKHAKGAKQEKVEGVSLSCQSGSDRPFVRDTTAACLADPFLSICVICGLTTS